MAKETERVRIRLDILGKIIGNLNTQVELEEIFGYPVANSLVIVADGNDLRIEAAKENLDGAEEEKFLRILDSVIKKNSADLKEL